LAKIEAFDKLHSAPLGGAGENAVFDVADEIEKYIRER
jgi:hypothetical protein